MTCLHIGNAIVCTRGRTASKCACCAQGAVFQCDWKVGSGKTCDAYLCAGHAYQVAEGKHLCPEHRDAYAAWHRARSEERAR